MEYTNETHRSIQYLHGLRAVVFNRSHLIITQPQVLLQHAND